MVKIIDLLGLNMMNSACPHGCLHPYSHKYIKSNMFSFSLNIGKCEQEKLAIV